VFLKIIYYLFQNFHAVVGIITNNYLLSIFLVVGDNTNNGDNTKYLLINDRLVVNYIEKKCVFFSTKCMFILYRYLNNGKNLLKIRFVAVS